MSGIDVENQGALLNAFSQVRPKVVINCVGLIKQLAKACDPLQSIPVNALLLYRLARLCAVSGARLVPEVHYPDSITLRTSVIGHALNTSGGLIDWFLGQQGQCGGFTCALFRIADRGADVDRVRCHNACFRVA